MCGGNDVQACHPSRQGGTGCWDAGQLRGQLPRRLLLQRKPSATLQAMSCSTACPGPFCLRCCTAVLLYRSWFPLLQVIKESALYKVAATGAKGAGSGDPPSYRITFPPTHKSSSTKVMPPGGPLC